MNQHDERDKDKDFGITPIPGWPPGKDHKRDKFDRDDKPVPTTSTGPRVQPDKDKGDCES